MAVKKSNELVKAEKSMPLSPFEEMERWFEEAWRRPFSLLRRPFWPDINLSELDEISPSVDIYDDGNDIVVKADLPGMKKKDISINLTDDILTISGEKKKEEKIERKDYHRYERTSGSFSRSFRLPEGIDTEKIRARYEDGVLEIRLPKTEEAKKHTRKITVE